jgi:acyl carrier protein
MNIEETVLDIMRQAFEVDEISTDVSQKNCAKWDSLHHLTMASDLEDHFDIELEPEEIAEMTDFTRVVEMLKSKL